MQTQRALLGTHAALEHISTKVIAQRIIKTRSQLPNYRHSHILKHHRSDGIPSTERDVGSKPAPCRPYKIQSLNTRKSPNPSFHVLLPFLPLRLISPIFSVFLLYIVLFCHDHSP